MCRAQPDGPLQINSSCSGSPLLRPKKQTTLLGCRKSSGSLCLCTHTHRCDRGAESGRDLWGNRSFGSFREWPKTRPVKQRTSPFSKARTVVPQVTALFKIVLSVTSMSFFGGGGTERIWDGSRFLGSSLLHERQKHESSACRCQLTKAPES